MGSVSAKGAKGFGIFKFEVKGTDPGDQAQTAVNQTFALSGAIPHSAQR
jgi:hypothetical protein